MRPLWHLRRTKGFSPINWLVMDPLREAYDEVYAYTMGRPRFILQHVVDAYAAQTASDGSKPMGVIFALVGLYLHVERQFSGHEVQKVHMQMGRQKRQWPAVTLPRDRGSMTAADVLVASEGRERDHAIDEWCRSVWASFRDSRQTIVDLLRQYQIS
jgi:hypothetical protein